MSVEEHNEHGEPALHIDNVGDPAGASSGSGAVLHWPTGPVLLVTVGVAILALPARLEGPPMWPIAAGHALSLVDAVGVVPLFVGALWLHAGLWQRRVRLVHWAAARPRAASLQFP